MTTGVGVVSCRTASACRLRSLTVCDGDSSFGSPCAGDTNVAGDPTIAGTHSCWEVGGGDVGGVKNSSSSEVSSTGPMVSGHLQNHFQTAALTRVTWRDDMVREKGSSRGFIQDGNHYIALLPMRILKSGRDKEVCLEVWKWNPGPALLLARESTYTCGVFAHGNALVTSACYKTLQHVSVRSPIYVPGSPSCASGTCRHPRYVGSAQPAGMAPPIHV